jgi:hypothetical protein
LIFSGLKFEIGEGQNYSNLRIWKIFLILEGKGLILMGCDLRPLK